MNSYNTDSLIISSHTYDKNNHLIAKVLYEYDASKKLGTAKLYNRKGKLDHSWNFDCNAKGEPDKKGKEEKVCKSNAQLANGHTQEITIEESKFNINKYIREFDEKGNLVLAETYTGKSGTILSYKAEFNKVGDTTFSRYYYYRSGMRKNYMYSVAAYTTIGNRKINSHYEFYRKKNKLEESSTYTYIYNYSGLIQNEVVNNEIKKTAKIINYSYTHF
jgi:hypothetical protein